MFQKASNNQKKIKLALSGASGSGKTMTALKIASSLETPIALIDTERGSANVYGDLFNFDICCLEYFSPQKYIEAINYAAKTGYKTIIIDSLSHCWYWQLEEVDKSQNSFQGWAKVRPLERQLMDCMLRVDAHIIATMRSKTEWLIEKDRQGRNIPKKIGTAPVQSSGIEYEFDIFGELNSENMLMITKSRCSQLSNRSFLAPGSEIAKILKKWTSENSSEPLRFVEPEEVDNLIKTQIDEATILANMKQIEERKVTASQLKRLYSIAHKSGLTDEEAQAVISGFGYQSAKDILMTKYDEVIEAIKTAKISNSEPWKDWKSEDDALAYAMNQLPDVAMNCITQEWNNLVPEECFDSRTGKTRYTKSRVWVKRIEELKNSGQ